jgi:hypothetical protein
MIKECGQLISFAKVGLMQEGKVRPAEALIPPQLTCAFGLKTFDGICIPKSNV